MPCGAAQGCQAPIHALMAPWGARLSGLKRLGGPVDALLLKVSVRSHGRAAPSSIWRAMKEHRSRCFSLSVSSAFSCTPPPTILPTSNREKGANCLLWEPKIIEPPIFLPPLAFSPLFQAPYSFSKECDSDKGRKVLEFFFFFWRMSTLRSPKLWHRQGECSERRRPFLFSSGSSLVETFSSQL